MLHITVNPLAPANREASDKPDGVKKERLIDYFRIKWNHTRAGVVYN